MIDDQFNVIKIFKLVIINDKSKFIRNFNLIIIK